MSSQEEYPLFQPWYDLSDLKALEIYLIEESKERNEYIFHRRRWKGNTEFNRMFKSETVRIIPMKAEGEICYEPKSVRIVYGPIFGKKREEAIKYFNELKEKLKINQNLIKIEPFEKFLEIGIDCEKLTIPRKEKLICCLFEFEKEIFGINFYSPEIYGSEILKSKN